jgi:putative hemolysin
MCKLNRNVACVSQGTEMLRASRGTEMSHVQVEKQKCHMCKSRNRNVTCASQGTEMSHVQVEEQKCHMCKRGTKM